MNKQTLAKLAMLGAMTTAYVFAYQLPAQGSHNQSWLGSKITAANTCSGGGGICNCSGKCIASGSGCECE